MNTFPGNILIVGLAVWFVYLLLRRILGEAYAKKNPEWVKAIFEQADQSTVIEVAPPEWVQQIDAEAAAFRQELITEAIRAQKEKSAPRGESYDSDWDYQAGKRKRPDVRYDQIK